MYCVRTYKRLQLLPPSSLWEFTCMLFSPKNAGRMFQWLRFGTRFDLDFIYLMSSLTCFTCKRS
jgi:hypothetical protein